MSSNQQLFDYFDGDPVDFEYHQDYNYSGPSEFYRTSLIITILLTTVPVIYHILYKLDYNLLSIPELLWNTFVYLTPSRLLDAIEQSRNPLRIQNPMKRKLSHTHELKSEQMRQILGLDKPQGIMNTVAQAGRRLSTFSGSFTSKAAEGRPAGLGNWDNSCYQNSVLQGLASLEPLPEYLTKPIMEAEAFSEKPNMNMATALKELIGALNNPSNNGRQIWTPAALKNMSSMQQQDAQEYFSKAMDEVDKEIHTVTKLARKLKGFESDEPKPENPEKSQALRNPLEGMMAQRVGCTRCGYSEGLSMIPFNCLTVPLGTVYRNYDVVDCLDEHTKLEMIEGVQCGRCTLLKYQGQLEMIAELRKDMSEDDQVFKTARERLPAAIEALENDDYDDKSLAKRFKIGAEKRVKSSKTRQAVIARPPMSLVIHFQRSIFDEYTGDLTKNTAGVTFPKVLDLGPWCLGSSGSILNSETEEWSLNPNVSMIASTAGRSRIRGPLYELRAVVTHYGRHENGHYVCYRKLPIVSDEGDDGPDKEQWWRLSDEEVYKVSEDSVLDQGGVFMLFFDLIKPATPNSAILEVPLEPATLKVAPSELAEQHVDASVGVAPPENIELAAKVPLPNLDDTDLSDSETASESTQTTRAESFNTSYSESGERKVTEAEETSYTPTKAVFAHRHNSQPGAPTNQGTEAKRQGIVPSGNLVMV